MRVSLKRGEDGAVSLTAHDPSGESVLAMGSLVLRPVEPSRLVGARRARDGHEALYRVEWRETPVVAVPADDARSVAILGDPRATHGYADLAALVQAIEGGLPAPDIVVASLPVGDAEGGGSPQDPRDGGLARAARARAREALELLQGWLARSELVGSRLVVLTCGAVAVGEGEVPDLVGASVWGLLRSAQAEHPGRFLVADCEWNGLGGAGLGEVGSEEAGLGVVGWLGVLESGESQVAVRGGLVFVPRLVSAGGGDVLVAPEGEGCWRLESGGGGTLEGLALSASPSAEGRLGVGQVRVGVRAGG